MMVYFPVNINSKNRFIAHYIDYDLIFKDDIVGIHSPINQKEELISIISFLDKNYTTLKAYSLAVSAKGGIHRSGRYVMNMKDIFNLPYPKDKKELELSYNEEIIKDDVLNYKLEELSKGEKAKINTQVASNKDLKAFGEVLCKNLNPIYQNKEKQFKALKPIHTISYTCYPIAYDDAQISKQLKEKLQDGDLSELIENEQESVLYRRILRLYKQDIIYLIKPNTLRYWLKSVALRDASDISAELVNNGY